MKTQLTVRVTQVCVELIKLERKGIPDCASDGEALESMVLRASTSPQARQIIRQAALKDPLFAAALEAAYIGNPGYEVNEAADVVASRLPGRLFVTIHFAAIRHAR